MIENLQPRRLSQEDSKRANAGSILREWSGLDSKYVNPAKNAQEIFSVYTRHMGCSYEETLKRAADALLAEWREENQ